MPYTPSVQDRTGEILAQGFSSLVQGLETYNKKKEEKEILNSTVTSLMSRAASSPKLAQFLGVNMSNEQAVRAGVIAAGGGDAMAGARALRQSLQQFGEFERKEIEKENNEAGFKFGMKAIMDGRDPFTAGAESNMTFNASVAGALADVQSTLALANERNRAPAPKLPQFQTIERMEDGVPVKVTIRINPDGTQTEIGRVRTDIQPGYRPSGDGASSGSVVPIPGSSTDPKAEGSPAQIAVKKASTDAATEARQVARATEIKQERAVKFIKAAESRKAELEFTLGLIEKADGLSRGGAGGAFDKFTTFTGGATDVLQDTIEAIQANTALDKMAELKSLSPTGSTGFANQSDKEGALMRDYRGKLKVGANEKQTQSVLKDMKAHIQRQLAGYNPKAALEVSSDDDALLNEFGIVQKKP